MPHVMHGPRIEDDGVSGGLSLSLGRNYDVDDRDLRFVPSLYGSVRRSTVPRDGDGVAASIGLQVPLLMAPLLVDNTTNDRFSILTATSYLDLYVQPRRRSEAGFETGVGVLASTALVTPYIQAGLMDENGSGWYTTQAVAFTVGDEFGDGSFYLPSVAWRHRDPETSLATNLHGGMGIRINGEDNTDMMFIMGVTFELGLGR
jgi:hypothetical protein